jgi:predicted TIM-barrel fold metal-dependent hydrolase
VKATPIPGKEWWDPYFEPIFKEIEKLGVPIIFHDTKTGSMGQERFADNFFFSHMVGRTIETMVCLMVYLCGGILEKFPDLKIICLETGASQMPWWLSRMDEHFEKLPHLVPWQKRKPTDIFNQSVYVGCEPFEDSLFEWAVEYLGGDRFVLATDSPHWDSSQPGQVTGPVAASTKISKENKRKVLGENAIRLLGLGL